jgi:alpha-L-rhamnosidase
MYNLQNRRMAPIRPHHTRNAVAVTSPAPNTYIFDMGYNAAGSCKFNVSKSIPAATTLQFTHGEILDATGHIIQSPTTPNRRDPSKGSMVETSSYVVSGDGSSEAYQPQFVYYGYRYVQVVSPVEPSRFDIECSDLSSDLQAAGSVTFAGGAVNEVRVLCIITRYFLVCFDTVDIGHDGSECVTNGCCSHHSIQLPRHSN